MGRFDSMKKDWNKPAPPPADSTSSDFELMPDGDYTCEIFNIEERQPKKGGEAFSVTLKVVVGDYEKRRVWDWINFNLPHSPKATEIGQQTFRELCAAAGFAASPPDELGDLIGQELKVRLGKRAAQGDWPEKNIVRRYLAYDAAPADDVDDLF